VLTIHHSAACNKERQYVFHVMLCEFLGLSYHTVLEDRNDLCITMNSNHEKQLIISDAFFLSVEPTWLQKASLPTQPLAVWNVEQKEIRELLLGKLLPVIYGEKRDSVHYLSEEHNQIKLGIDVFGSAFFMLTRYEELAKREFDGHGRFSAKSSLAYQEGFLERPIINEYLEILWWCMKKLWPEIKRKPRQFKMLATHDVDYPFAYAFTSWQQTCRSMAADLVKRHNPLEGFRRMVQTRRVKSGHYHSDKNYTFDQIMDISETNNIKSCFYFMTNHVNTKHDTFYPLEHPFVKELLCHIHDRGHEIGLHCSYESYGNGVQIKDEFYRLQEICHSLGISQKYFGGRQHYLRWSSDTWQYYEDAGLVYDTSLSYADHIGFRCGVCFEYPVYNLQARTALKLYERPLLVMECSALDGQYMGLSCEQAKYEMRKLREATRKYRGNFVLLWHNDRLTTNNYMNTYQSLFK
jgi:hypothetical protein